MKKKAVHWDKSMERLKKMKVRREFMLPCVVCKEVHRDLYFDGLKRAAGLMFDKYEGYCEKCWSFYLRLDAVRQKVFVQCVKERRIGKNKFRYAIEVYMQECPEKLEEFRKEAMVEAL